MWSCAWGEFRTQPRNGWGEASAFTKARRYFKASLWCRIPPPIAGAFIAGTLAQSAGDRWADFGLLPGMAKLSENEMKTSILDFLRMHAFSLNYPRTDFEFHQVRAIAPENSPSEILAVCWSLVADGIIAPGMRKYLDVPQGVRYTGSPGDLYSFTSLYVTEFGRRFLAESKDVPTPLEGARYRKSVTERMPDASEVIVRYVDEAMASYERRLDLAATVLIGVAAEEVAERLYRALAAHLDPTRSKSFAESMHKKRGSANEKLEQFIRTFDAHKADLEEQLRRRVDTYLIYLVNVLKLSRDDAGHAHVARVDREVAYMMLVSFPVLVGVVVEIEAALAGPCTLTP